MPSLKEIRSRISSVQSTQQITKAMKMVAAAKLRRAQDGITRMRPYAAKLNAMMANVSASLPEDQASLYATERPAQRVMIVLITSDRGLCGAFNTNLFKALQQLLATDYASHAASGNLRVMTVGRKGHEYANRRSMLVEGQYSNLMEGLSFEKAKAAAEYAMEQFATGQVDKVVLLYNEFKNVATQIVRSEQMLPIVPPARVETDAKVDYLFSPSAAFVMEELIPKAIKVQLYKAVLDSNAAEQGARMTAMDKATDNAGELLKALKLTYNRSRQAAITKEILEIVGGAEALD